MKTQRARYYGAVAIFSGCCGFAAIGFLCFSYAHCCKSEHSKPAKPGVAKCSAFCLLLIATLTLVLGGMLMTTAVVLTDLCHWSQNTILSSPTGLQRLLKEAGASEEAITVFETCFAPKSTDPAVWTAADLYDGNLIKALRLEQAIESAEELRGEVTALENRLTDVTSMLTEQVGQRPPEGEAVKDHARRKGAVGEFEVFIRSARDLVDALGWVLPMNVSSLARAGESMRLESYDTVLLSGVQDKQREMVIPNFLLENGLLEESAIGGTPIAVAVQSAYRRSAARGEESTSLTVFGLLDVETVIFPFFLQALHPAGQVNVPIDYMVTSDFDPASPLVMFEAAKKASAQESRMFRNALWIAHKKQMLRDTEDRPFVCAAPPVSELTSDEFAECSYPDFVKSLDESTNKLEDQVDRVVQSLLDAGDSFIANVNRTVESVVEPIDILVKGADCSSLHFWASHAVDTGCSHFVNNLTLVAVIWVIVGIQCLLTCCVYEMVAKHLRHMGELFAAEGAARRPLPTGRGQPIPGSMPTAQAAALNREYDEIAGNPSWMKFDKDKPTGGRPSTAYGGDSRNIRYL
eukprot:Selendium_serpulae@DN3961_c0_g1_i4.p1